MKTPTYDDPDYGDEKAIKYCSRDLTVQPGRRSRRRQQTQIPSFLKVRISKQYLLILVPRILDERALKNEKCADPHCGTPNFESNFDTSAVHTRP